MRVVRGCLAVLRGMSPSHHAMLRVLFFQLSVPLELSHKISEGEYGVGMVEVVHFVEKVDLRSTEHEL